MARTTQKTFVRPTFSALPQDGPAGIRTIIDLIKYNALHNPDWRFCLQAESSVRSNDGTRWNLREISFKDLDRAIGACCRWLADTGAIETPSCDKRAPIAVFLESDVSLFIYLVALSALNVPVVLLSARLGADNISHLLATTGAKHVLASSRTHNLLVGKVTKEVEVMKVVTYQYFLQHNDSTRADIDEVDWAAHMHFDEADRNVFIIHSSGTTGRPKPIRLGHRYLLGFAACHSFPSEINSMWPNLSTLPLYHAFGMLAPSLSLSIGMTCCFPPSSIIPGARSTVDLIGIFRARSVMSVPSIIQDMVNLAEPARAEVLQVLADMKFVAVGGGPLDPNVATELGKANVALLNHYGVTEIGGITPIVVPPPGYDPRFIRLRKDINLQLRLIEGTSTKQKIARYKLVGYPSAWDKPFEIQDEIEKRPIQDGDHVDIRILGRRDDLIVLRTGEKISPGQVEGPLMLDPNIKTAACIGSGFLELVVIIEPSESSSLDVDALKAHVWDLLTKINLSLDGHARISSQEAVIIKSAEKKIPRTDKGAVMRKELQHLFEMEISEAYTAIETESYAANIEIDPTDIELSIQRAIEFVTGGKFSAGSFSRDQDLFECGMDSLEATRLARALTCILETNDSRKTLQLSREFVYQFATVHKLAQACIKVKDGNNTAVTSEDNKTDVLGLMTEYVNKVPRDEVPRDTANILLTGSTGNLGIHVLAQLAKTKEIYSIICIGRNGIGKAEYLRERQENACKLANLSLTVEEWAKVHYIDCDLSQPSLGLTAEEYTSLLGTVTDVIHLAWPMDFNMQLESYRPQLDSMQSLIALCYAVHSERRSVMPRLIFASSISIVRYHAERTGQRIVFEQDMEDPRVCAHMGYAKAKWICEKMLKRASNTLGHRMEPMIVRIGQLSGPENSAGIWKTQEHIPILLKYSQQVSAFPVLDGDFSWLPVDRASNSLLEILLRPRDSSSLHYHLENPIRQPLKDLGILAVNQLGLRHGLIPFEQWLEKVSQISEDLSLLEFFKSDFRALAGGAVVLDTSISRGASRTLSDSGSCNQELLVEYIERWKRLAFLA